MFHAISQLWAAPRPWAPPCAVPSFHLLAAPGLPPFALHTWWPAWLLHWPSCRWAHQPRRRQTGTPQTATLPVVEVTEGSATPNGKPRHPVETGSPPGLTARETPASVTVVDRATIEARAPRTPRKLRAIARRDHARCAGRRGRELPWFLQRLAGPVIQRHHGAVQHCRRGPWTAGSTTGWRPLAARRASCSARARWAGYQLHHQNARAHRLHRSAGACWLAPAARSVHRHQPPPGLCGPQPRMR